MGLKDLGKQVKKERKELDKPVEKRFLEAIDNYPVKERPSSFSIKPSGYYKCMRAVWYETLRYPDKSKTYPRSKRIFGIGTYSHLYIQDDVIKALAESPDFPLELMPKDELFAPNTEGIEFVEHGSSSIEFKIRDRRFTTKYPISYMTDGTIEFEGIRYLFEFKTIKSEDFQFLIEPLKDHKAQGAVYALSTGIRKIIFLYINKDNQELKCYTHDYTDEQIDWARDRVAQIDRHLVELTLPEKEVNEQECKWCGFREYCDKDKTAKEYKEVDGFSVFKE